MQKLGAVMPEIRGLDIDRFPADEIATKMRLPEFKILELLEAFLEVLEDIEYERKRQRRHFYIKQSSLEASPYAYELYNRLYKGKEDCLMLKDPSLRNEQHSSDTLRFWSQPSAQHILFENLIGDGYYERRSLKEIFRCRVPKMVEK
jgi:hypothetical protein